MVRLGLGGRTKPFCSVYFLLERGGRRLCHCLKDHIKAGDNMTGDIVGSNEYVHIDDISLDAPERVCVLFRRMETTFPLLHIEYWLQRKLPTIQGHSGVPFFGVSMSH